jgi:hypothetical protein
MYRQVKMGSHRALTPCYVAEPEFVPEISGCDAKILRDVAKPALCQLDPVPMKRIALPCRNFAVGPTPAAIDTLYSQLTTAFQMLELPNP